jgi:hypothetical protein
MLQDEMAEREGIRTHGTVTHTTVFEFYDSNAGPCRSVAKRVLQFGISSVMILVCDVPCRAVVRGSFAIPFAKLPPAVGYERGVGQTRSLRSSWHAAIASRHLLCVPRTGSVMQYLGAGYRLRSLQLVAALAPSSSERATGARNE